MRFLLAREESQEELVVFGVKDQKGVLFHLCNGNAGTVFKDEEWKEACGVGLLVMIRAVLVAMALCSKGGSGVWKKLSENVAEHGWLMLLVFGMRFC